MARDKKHCPLEPTCSLYNLFRLAGMQGLWQSLYCHGGHDRCERYKLDCQGRPIPKLLLPDGKLLQLKRGSPSLAPKKGL